MLYHFLSSKTITLYFSDDCGHCQKFKPEWEKIKNSGLVNAREVNCKQNPDQCNNIEGYPTIRITNGFTVSDYENGARTLDDIVRFYNNV